MRQGGQILQQENKGWTELCHTLDQTKTKKMPPPPKKKFTYSGRICRFAQFFSSCSPEIFSLMFDWHPYFIPITDVFLSLDSFIWYEFGLKDVQESNDDSLIRSRIQSQFTYMLGNLKSKVDSCKWLWILCWFPYEGRYPESIPIWGRESIVNSRICSAI